MFLLFQSVPESITFFIKSKFYNITLETANEIAKQVFTLQLQGLLEISPFLGGKIGYTATLTKKGRKYLNS